MFCRLCMNETEVYQNLYDPQGLESDVYKVVAKYFEKQVLDTKESAQTICSSCWERIHDFHTFRESILAAHEKHEQLMDMKFEEVVKMEVEMDFPSLDEGTGFIKEEQDPVDVIAKNPIQDLHVSDDDVKAGFSDADYNDSDDDKPLLTRRACNTRGRKKRKSAKSSNETKVKKSKKPREKCIPTAASTNDVEADNTNKVNKKSLQTKTQMYDAFIAQHFKTELNCEVCDKVVENFTSLRFHFREAHNTDNCYVTCCENKYSQRFHLVEHLRVHLNPNYFKCAECGKCSTNRRNLMTHMKSMHGSSPLERSYECDICNKRFAKKAILRSHMDIHATGSKDYVCKDCGKGFVLENRLNIHIRNVHNIDQCVCEQCGKSCRGRYALKRHLLDHEGGGKRTWACDQCEAQLHSKYSLKRHKRLAHHDRSTLYVCSECGKVSLTADALRSHKKYVHERERKYKCNICEKAFKTPNVLKEHMTTHTGQDLYKCPHCPKTFKVNSNMHHHRKRAHPKEWAENRRHKPFVPKLDLSMISNEVVM